METFQRVFQPEIEEIFNKDFHLKGRWASGVFNNSNPIILELGCGKGEYTVAQAAMWPDKNFIGVDIKGARIWTGAKASNEKELKNVAFIRTRIEFIKSFFGSGEVEEIWITFPDPQLKRKRNKKRLTGSIFLNQYRFFLKDKGIVHLKTDNDVMFNYTSIIVRANGLEILAETDDLYNSPVLNKTLSIKTYYEKQFLVKEKNINYISFRLQQKREIVEAFDKNE